MAIEQHKRIRYIDFVRLVIGDPDALLFSDDEIKSVCDKWSSTDTTTHNITAYNNRYRVHSCRNGVPVYELSVSSGDDGAVYILDESAGIVFFDPEDPDNTAVAPVDGTTIEVTYYTINTPEAISELFFILSSNHTKLTSAQSIMGVSMDLKELADSFYNQSIRWRIERCTF